MGSKAHQVTVIVIGLSVNQDEIRPEVAVAMICPLPGKRVVTMTLLDFSIFRQFGHHMSQIRIKTFSEPPLFSRRKSLLKVLVRLIVRIQIGHQVVDIADLGQLAPPRSQWHSV